MAVDRCVCHERMFAEILTIARERGLDLEGLQREDVCSSGCGLCGPYVELMLETGRTEFEPMSAERVRGEIRAAREKNE